MPGEKDLNVLLACMRPEQQPGDYVFCTVDDRTKIPDSVLMLFREKEGTTLILRREHADALHLPYAFVAAWIMLTVNSSLEAVGLTAAFAGALAKEGVSCNVVAAYHHDHIFVNKADAEKALAILQRLSEASAQ